MDKLFEKIINVIDKMPVPFQVLGLFFLVLLFYLYRLLTNKKVQNSLLLRMQKKLGNLTEKDLKLHRLFGQREVYAVKINNIKFASGHKSKIFRIILSVKMDIDLVMTKAIIEKEGLFDMDKHLLCSEMLSLVNKIIKAYEAKAKELLQLEYGISTGTKLFDFVMNSPGGFREKRYDRLNRIIIQVDEYIRNSQIFDNNIERIESFLTEIQYALRSSIFEAEKMFAGLNGEIDKIVADGLK